VKERARERLTLPGESVATTTLALTRKRLITMSIEH